MKPFHELDCPQLEIIQAEALTWLKSRYDLSDQASLKTDLWLKIDSPDFLKSNPTLVSWFRSLDLKCRETAITVINDASGADLHIDEPPLITKINIPILNYQNVVNEWYHIPENIISDTGPSVNQFGSKYYLLDKIDMTQCKLLDSIILKKPVVFNSQIAHRVVCLPGAMFPRVVLTCMFFKELFHYLKS